MTVTAETMHSYEPAQGHGLKHDPFNAIVGPRPIGWIASQGASGAVNLAPYSFFNAFNYHPPIIGFSSIGWKDTVANISETGEFVWNLATRAIADKMNATSATVPRGTDEFDLGQLTKLPSTKVKPPRVAESPVHFECKLTQLLQLEGVGGRKVETWMVFGEVVAVHIDPELIEDGVYQTAKPHPILRAGRWGDYAEITPDRMFVMPRPNPPGS
jgi:flavin reductase (DIM6/NTAB) family NADH-FMN oxidoreductase RutF